MKTLSLIHQQWKCIFVFVFLWNVSSTIYAQDTVNPIVVSASRVAQTLSDVLPSVTVITRAEIERSLAPTVADLLQGEAGFEFGRNGGPGTVTSFFLRGQNSVSVAIYVDGVRSQVDSIGTVNAIDFPISQIEKIEILRGNAGALYGEAAIGGVINITTRRGGGNPSQYASVSYGSRNTSEVVVGYSGGVDDLTFNISANQFQTDGFSAINTNQIKFANPDNDGATNRTFLASLSKNINSDLSLGLRLKSSRNEASYDDFFASSVADQTATHLFKTLNDDVTIFSNYQINPNWVTRLDVTESRLQYEDYQNGIQKSAASGGYTLGRQTSERWFNTYQYGTHRFNFGIDAYQADYTSFGSTVQRTSNGYFLGYNKKFEQVDLQLNARHDEILATSNQTSKANSANTYLFGLGYYLTEQFKLTSTVSTAFRAPAAGELFGFGGNSNLNPEIHHSNELGVVYSLNNALVRLVRFNTSTDNAIVYASSTYSNVPKVQNTGYELTSNIAWNKYRLRFSAVSQDPKDIQTGLQLARRAQQYGSIDLNRIFDFGYEVGTRIYAVSDRVDGTNNLAGYTVLNVYGGKRLDKDWMIRAKVENVANTDYQLAYGYKTPGFGVFMNLIYQPQ